MYFPLKDGTKRVTPSTGRLGISPVVLAGWSACYFLASSMPRFEKSRPRRISDVWSLTASNSKRPGEVDGKCSNELRDFRESLPYQQEALVRQGDLGPCPRTRAIKLSMALVPNNNFNLFLSLSDENERWITLVRNLGSKASGPLRPPPRVGPLIPLPFWFPTRDVTWIRRRCFTCFSKSWDVSLSPDPSSPGLLSIAPKAWARPGLFVLAWGTKVVIWCALLHQIFDISSALPFFFFFFFSCKETTQPRTWR